VSPARFERAVRRGPRGTRRPSARSCCATRRASGVAPSVCAMPNRLDERLLVANQRQHDGAVEIPTRCAKRCRRGAPIAAKHRIPRCRRRCSELHGEARHRRPGADAQQVLGIRRRGACDVRKHALDRRRLAREQRTLDRQLEHGHEPLQLPRPLGPRASRRRTEASARSASTRPRARRRSASTRSARRCRRRRSSPSPTPFWSGRTRSASRLEGPPAARPVTCRSRGGMVELVPPKTRKDEG